MVRVVVSDEVIELAGQYLDCGNVEMMWQTLVEGSVEVDEQSIETTDLVGAIEEIVACFVTYTVKDVPEGVVKTILCCPVE